MKSSKGLLAALILIFFSFEVAGFYPEGRKKTTLQEKVDITQQEQSDKDMKTQEEKKPEEKKILPSEEAKQKYDYSAEELLKESQRNVDRSISILNVVATIMGVLVGLITIIIIIAVALGVFEYRKYRRIIRTAERITKHIEDIKNKGEEALAKVGKPIREASSVSLAEELSPELKERFDEYNRRLEFIEMFGLPLKSEDYVNRGYDLYGKNKFEEALRNFEEAIKLESNSFRGWLGKGQALDKLERFEESLIASEKCIELKPEESFTWSNKGSALIDLKRYEEALKPIEKALEILPINPSAWANKGCALFGLERYDESLEAFKEALKLKPDDALSSYNVACIYSLKNDKTNALDYLAKVVNLDNSFAERAKKDKDFEPLWNDDDFKDIVG